jgi:hypothetical protein
MSRPKRVPDKGDVPAAVVAARLGLSIGDFDTRRAALTERGFPDPDPTTGLWCMEAVDRWRLRRHSQLFPELRNDPIAVDAATVFDGRLRRLDG